MDKMNFVFGHKKPDTDSIASAIAMANLQSNIGDYSESFRLGNVNRETEFALKTFGVKVPELLEKVDENSNVIMVDSNEFTQSVDGIENANIKMIVDHHRLNLQTTNPVFCMVEPVGCTSTILYKLYKQNDIDIKPEMAGLMLSAIVSDTLLFKSPTPITISGLNSLIIFLHSLNALNKHLTVFTFRKIFLLNPYISIDLKGIPLAGTISFSILLWVPIYKNSLSGSFSLILLIIAKAG